MQPAVLRTLEFDRIRGALAQEALTPLGRERARSLEPAVDPADVRHRLDLTTEAVAFVRDGGSLAIFAPENLLAIAEALEIEHQALHTFPLLRLARFVESVEAVAAGITRASHARLAAIADRAASFDDEIRSVRHAI